MQPLNQCLTVDRKRCSHWGRALRIHVATAEGFQGPWKQPWALTDQMFITSKNMDLTIKHVVTLTIRECNQQKLEFHHSKQKMCCLTFARRKMPWAMAYQDCFGLRTGEFPIWMLGFVACSLWLSVSVGQLLLKDGTIGQVLHGRYVYKQQTLTQTRGSERFYPNIFRATCAICTYRITYIYIILQTCLGWDIQKRVYPSSPVTIPGKGDLTTVSWHHICCMSRGCSSS